MGLDLYGAVEYRARGMWDSILLLNPFFGRRDYSVLYDLVRQIEEETDQVRLFPSNEHATLNGDTFIKNLSDPVFFAEDEAISSTVDTWLDNDGNTPISPTWLSYDEFSRISEQFVPAYITLGVRLINQIAVHYDPANVRLVFWLW